MRMRRAAALAVGLLLTACSAAPTAGPTPTATVAAASPSPTAAATTPPTPAPSSSPTPIALPSIAQLSAPSGSIVWALVGGTRLFRSTDRGDTWQERPLGAQPINGQVAFIDDHEGWESAVGSAATGCQSQLVTISHTVDASASWQQLAANGLSASQCKGALYFASSSSGYLAASDRDHSPLVYFTTTGGLIWTASRPLADPPGFTTTPGGSALTPVSIRGFGAVLVADVAGPSHFAYRSSDGGATWTYAALAPDPASPIAFVSATRWLQIGAPGQSRETTDGGATWHAFTTDYSQAAPIAPSIIFGDAQTGYATVRGAIQRTVDGGAHWKSIRTPGTF